MRKKILIYALFAVLGLGFVGTGSASAHGWFWSAAPDELASRQQAMFESQAKILGISADEFKNKWAEGKTVWEIAQEKGLTPEQLQAKMLEAKKEELRSQLKTLASKSVITQAQAEARLKFMESQLTKKMGWGRPFRGMHKGWGLGF